MYNTIDFMAANYNTNKSHFIEVAELALSDQTTLDELKSNYYALIAQDPDARTVDGMKSFAMESLP